MAPRYKQNVVVAEIHLRNILMAMSRLTLSKDDAAWIVGGRKRLLDLISSGEIEVAHSGKNKNSKWKCNAGQVLKHCRRME